MLNVIVERTKWHRGKGGHTSALLKENGRMCCLGFACLAAGLTEDAIRDVLLPVQVEGIDATVLSGLPIRFAFQLVSINDRQDIDDNVREAELKEMGEEVGIAFQFI